MPVLGDWVYQVPLSSVPRHTVNLLGNLPLKCLDVLLTLEPHEGSLEFLGVNMDVIGVLLSFLEKRLHQVGRGTCCGCGPGLPEQLWSLVFVVHAGKWRAAPQCEAGDAPAPPWCGHAGGRSLLPEKHLETSFQDLAKYSFFRSLCGSSSGPEKPAHP